MNTKTKSKFLIRELVFYYKKGKGSISKAQEQFTIVDYNDVLSLREYNR